ncbi:WD40 repeat-like protein [Podospora australis]|uniref:WD40 repeat-like protein n=1 Tax=Podospora australis TaxID=1536484 RepID=A0AAN7AGS2_9PEZI|nr:WD40 repeat-like protein [Podospora australis]
MTHRSPYPPRSRRKHEQACSSPSGHPSGTPDSGYGTSLSTPTSTGTALSSVRNHSTAHAHRLRSPITPTKTRPVPKKEGHPFASLWKTCDGNLSDSDDQGLRDSEDDPFDQTASPSPVQGRRLPERFHRKTITLPIGSSRPRPALPASFSFNSGAGLQRSGPTSGSSRSSWTRQLDRFIPARPKLAETTSERFRTSKPTHELTQSEKLLRHNGGTEDAFCFRRRVVTPMAQDYRALTHPDYNFTTPSLHTTGNVLGPLDQNGILSGQRQASIGAAWSVGGVAPGGTAVNNGRGQLVRSSTNARLYRTTFPSAVPKVEEELEKHGARIATALGLDRAERVLRVNAPVHQESKASKARKKTMTLWNGTEWVQDGRFVESQKTPASRSLPIAPFKVLDAPNLRDDFYCSILAYCYTRQTLAIGLGDLLYGWSEQGGVRLLNTGLSHEPEVQSYLTCLAFSSTEGGKAILAYGRSNGCLGIMSLNDDVPSPVGNTRSTQLKPRFMIRAPSGIACLSWRPRCTKRRTKNPHIPPETEVMTEDLLVRDDEGHVYYYIVEWPAVWEVNRDMWKGEMTLMVDIKVHSQQICGLAWSPNGDLFATGGNDNRCCLFETAKVLQGNIRGARYMDEVEDPEQDEDLSDLDAPEEEAPNQPQPQDVKDIVLGDEKHRWDHGAAVKAIAFCPWQEGLVATGGGSNDKCIHFFHTTSGAALATISVSAQVTSLIWSTTRREIAATFGFAQPEHQIRIAVFSWPECRQVAAIPWPGEHRALFAIPYPSGPAELRIAKSETVARTSSRSRTSMEGCIMVASSDNSVKFHEVWAADKKATAGGVRMLGGSDILEGLEGIDKDGDVIR